MILHQVCDDTIMTDTSSLSRERVYDKSVILELYENEEDDGSNGSNNESYSDSSSDNSGGVDVSLCSCML
jgi:hypothetical protein